METEQNKKLIPSSGPWSRTPSNEIVSGVGYDRVVIARMAKKANGFDLPSEANARIMAGSFDMFIVCKHIYDLSAAESKEEKIHRLEMIIDMAQEVIEKIVSE